MSEWRYIAIRLNGDGTQEILHTELPLSDVHIRGTLSGPDGLTATIKPEVVGLRTSDGVPIFVEWSTLILAEKDGLIRGGGILDELVEVGSRLSLDCVGPSGYPKGMPYVLDNSWVGIDPMEVIRHIWGHLQSSPSGNLGVEVVTNKSPVRIGTPERDVSFQAGGEDVNFTAGPYVLAWWKTHDLGRELDELVKTTPAQYRTSWRWVGDKAVATIEYRYPMLGRRVTDARFVVGENILVLPTINSGGGYASDVLVLGAGSGRTIRNGSDTLPKKDRLRRVVVLEDKSIESNARARDLAVAELRARQGGNEVTDIRVEDHPNAAVGSYEVGDEILIIVPSDWSGSLEAWYKVISLDLDPVTGVTDLQVVRVEKLG